MNEAFLPLGIRMQGRTVTIVGAGAVAARKGNKLVSAGAKLSVIAPRFLPSRDYWHGLGATIIEQSYAGLDDAARPFLVIAATDDPSINAQVARDARALGALVVRSDDPEDSDLAFPATLRRGKLTVSYATDGASPALARLLRAQAEVQFDDTYGVLIEVLVRLRQATAFEALAPREQRAFLNWERVTAARRIIERLGADAAFDALVTELGALGPNAVASATHRDLVAQAPARGLFIVHTGDGKGKTSAALNLVYRHLAHGKSACVVQFIKNANDFAYGDVILLERLRALGLPVTVTMLGAGYTWRTGDSDECRRLAALGWERAVAAILDPRVDLVVCDELHIALRHGHLELDPVLQTIGSRPALSHVVSTGRDAPDELLAIADLVTDFVAVKHPFSRGVRAQAGIEY